MYVSMSICVRSQIHVYHLFIQAISIAPLQVHYSSETLPDTARILCRSFMPKRHRQLRVKELPKVPTWRLERDLNPRPFGRKALNLPMCNHVSQIILYINICMHVSIYVCITALNIKLCLYCNYKYDNLYSTVSSKPHLGCFTRLYECLSCELFM